MQTIVTAQVERIVKSKETVALKLADGKLRAVKVQDPANLEKVKVGDTIVITITKEMAISVQKTNERVGKVPSSLLTLAEEAVIGRRKAKKVIFNSIVGLFFVIQSGGRF